MKIFVRFTNLLDGVLSDANAAQKNRIPDFVQYLVSVVWHCRQSDDCFSQNMFIDTTE